MDVAVKLKDGHEYGVVGATPKNLLALMDTKRSKFLDDLLEKDKSIEIENYDLIDFKINNIKNDSNLKWLER